MLVYFVVEGFSRQRLDSRVLLLEHFVNVLQLVFSFFNILQPTSGSKPHWD